jgi:hypothetical protein
MSLCPAGEHKVSMEVTLSSMLAPVMACMEELLSSLLAATLL